MAILGNSIPELLGSRVRTSNYESVVEKIRQLSEGGKDKLQIISDFDKTLSKYHSNGTLTPSSHGVFGSIPEMPGAYVEGADALYKKYGAIEWDTKMSIAEKIPYMEEWWYHYEKLVKQLPLNHTSIDQAVLHNHISLRDGVKEAFRELAGARVPVLVFSAGLGDVIDSSLKLNGLNHSNVHVVSNFFHYVDNHIQGFKGSFIHVFNKNQHAVENSDYFQELSERKNVILLGDSLGDSFMAEGVPDNGTLLKIGFLNSQIEESLPSYLSHFDIVLEDDQTMDVFNAILRCIL